MVKWARPGRADECWVEKFSCELCRVMDIPHAEYELCRRVHSDGAVERGVVTLNMCRVTERLTHGNDLLSREVTDYPLDMTKGKVNPFYTVENVLQCLQRLEADEEVKWQGVSGRRLFCQYLALDTIIGNQDRHHLNWAVLEDEDRRSRRMAPTFDHGAGLGRGLTDRERRQRLESRDRGYCVGTYAGKARSMFAGVDQAGKTRRITTLEALQAALLSFPEARCDVINAALRVNSDSVSEILNDIPQDFASDTAKRFAERLIFENISRILANV